MKAHKRKIETTHNLLVSEGYHPYYWWDDDWDYFDVIGRDLAIDYEYVNIDKPTQPRFQAQLAKSPYRLKCYGMRFRAVPITSQNSGLLINLDSVYSKEVLRQKKIDKILGDDIDIPNTIENIAKIND